MTIREVAIAKLQQLPEPLLQQVNDFIDLLTERQQNGTTTDDPQEELAQAWVQWFSTVDQMEVKPSQATSEYQHQLLSKYRQQGLDL